MKHLKCVRIFFEFARSRKYLVYLVECRGLLVEQRVKNIFLTFENYVTLNRVYIRHDPSIVSNWIYFLSFFFKTARIIFYVYEKTTKKSKIHNGHVLPRQYECISFWKTLNHSNIPNGACRLKRRNWYRFIVRRRRTDTIARWNIHDNNARSPIELPM